MVNPKTILLPTLKTMKSCTYLNNNSQLVIVKISLQDRLLEKVLLQGESINFQTNNLNNMIEIYKYSYVTTLISDRIPLSEICSD